MNEHSLAKSNQKEALSAETECTASHIGDNNSLIEQLGAVRLNGICTMNMVKSLVAMVSKLSSEVQQLRNDNETLKIQLRDLHQAPSHMPLIRREVASSAAGNSATAKSYRDVVASMGGNPGATVVSAPPRNSVPESSIVTGEITPDDGFVTVLRKKRVNPSPVSTSAISNTTKKPRIPMIGVRSSSSLSVVQKRLRRKSLFVSRFSPEVTTSDVEKSLKDQLQLASLTCTRLKTKYNSYASFHVSVTEDDFHLINNTGVWPNGCLITPYYGRLNPDQIYSVDIPATSRPASPSAGSLRPSSPPTLDALGDFVNTDGAQGEAAPALS
jgi:hypothetical protein